MLADFYKAYKPVKEFEGGWCNVKHDAGGETYMGIARNFFGNWKGWKIVDREKADPSFKQGSRTFSKHLAQNQELTGLVEQWYIDEWWEPLQLSLLPQNIANELFEQAINLGKGGMSKILQRFCNAANYSNATEKPLFVDLKIDGVSGRKTRDALIAVLKVYGAATVVHVLNGMQCAYYVDIALRKQTHRKFLKGWLTRTYCTGESHAS